MDQHREGGLVELFYDAVFAPALWPVALEELADQVSGAGAALLSADRPDGIWVRVDPAARAVFDGRFRNRNPFASHVAHLRTRPGYRPAIVTDEQVLSRSELQRTEYFNDFMQPYDGASMMVVDLGVQGISAAVNIARTPSAGGFGDEPRRMMRDLQCDLTRAFWLTVRLGLSGALEESLIPILDRSDHGFLLLDRRGAVVYANSAANMVLAERDGLLSVRDQLTADVADDRARLTRAIGAATSGVNGTRSADWLAVRREPPAPPLKIAVAPLSIDRPAFFEVRASAIVCIVDGNARARLSVDQLRALFDLTPAQAQVALKMAEGANLASAAEALGISTNTARVHLHEVFGKTSTNRQAELIHLLARMGLQSLV